MKYTPSEYQSRKRELTFREDPWGRMIPTRECGGIISLAKLIEQLGLLGRRGSKVLTRVDFGRPLIAIFVVYKLGPRPVERSVNPWAELV